MEDRKQKKNFIIWLAVGSSLFTLAMAALSIMQQAPELKFFLGLLTGMGVVLIFVALWNFFKGNH